jgi:hypothetical protein
MVPWYWLLWPFAVALVFVLALGLQWRIKPPPEDR